MGVDFKDFQQTSITNVVLQKIAELTIRPKYGAAKQLTWADSIDDGAVRTLFTESSKGIIYGGCFYSYGAAMSHGEDELIVVVDDFPLYTPSLSGMVKRNLTQYPSGAFTLTLYDDVNYRYSVILLKGITFESSIYVRYNNVTAEDVFVDAKMIYAII